MLGMQRTIVVAIVVIVAFTLAAITIVHYFLTMPTEASRGRQGVSNASATNSKLQATPPATSGNSVTEWVRESGTVLKEVLSNVTCVLEKSSNTTFRSLISASLPKGITVYDVLHATVVNNSVVVIGNRTFKYVLLGYCLLGQCNEIKGTANLGPYTLSLQQPPKTITTTGGQVTYVLIKKDGRLVGNLSHYYIPFVISNYWVTISMSAVNLSDGHVIYFLQIYGLPDNGLEKMFFAWLALMPES